MGLNLLPALVARSSLPFRIAAHKSASSPLATRRPRRALGAECYPPRQSSKTVFIERLARFVECSGPGPASLHGSMDTRRSTAYGRVMKTLADPGLAPLTAEEQEVVRTAADALFFDGDGYDELVAVEDLAQHLVDAQRWPAARARQLVDDVASCGPTAGVR